MKTNWLKRTLMGVAASAALIGVAAYAQGAFHGGPPKIRGGEAVMRFATKHGMSRPALMRFALKLLANLTDPGGDATDRLVNGLSRLAPNPE